MLIAITGRAHAGKTTTAKMIRSVLGNEIYSFARPLKEALHCIFGWTEAHTDGHLKETIDPRYGISPRQAMMSIGQWGRNILPQEHPMFAVVTGDRLWAERLRSLYLDDPRDYVIDDLRRENELAVVRELGGYVIRVYGEHQISIDDESENQIDTMEVDEAIENSGTFGELKDKVDALINDLVFSDIMEGEE